MKRKKGHASSIDNIDDLRDHALNTLAKLGEGDIDVAEAGITAKLYESVMSTVKAQIQVAAMLHREPNIPFLGNTAKGKRLPIEYKNETARIAKDNK